jgi:hypothetical protein
LSGARRGRYRREGVVIGGRWGAWSSGAGAGLASWAALARAQEREGEVGPTAEQKELGWAFPFLLSI